MYLYKYKVTFKFWCCVCCQILCLKNNTITFLLPVTCRITTIVFYLWVKPPLCIFHWNEEPALGYSLQTWCITNTLQKPQWEYRVANQCLPISDLPIYGLETWSDPPCGLLGKTGLLGRFLAVVLCWSLPLKDFCDHLASSQLWQSWLWSFQTSFLFQGTFSLCSRKVSGTTVSNVFVVLYFVSWARTSSLLGENKSCCGMCYLGFLTGL